MGCFSISNVYRSPVFYSLMVTMGIFNSLTVVGNLFATYIYHLSDSGVSSITSENAVMLASGVAACIMALSAAGKILGAVSYKSLCIALCIPCICGATSIVCMWLGAPISSVFIYAGGLLRGVLYAAVDALWGIVYKTNRRTSGLYLNLFPSCHCGKCRRSNICDVICSRG